MKLFFDKNIIFVSKNPKEHGFSHGFSRSSPGSSAHKPMHKPVYRGQQGVVILNLVFTSWLKWVLWP
jgi:hypothetical protein